MKRQTTKRRIAWIEHLFESEAHEKRLSDFSREMKKRGLILHGAETLSKFRETHGDIRDYDGIIMHPGISQQETITEVKYDNPNMPLAVVSNFTRDYSDKGIALFDYESYDKIAEFFESGGKQK